MFIILFSTSDGHAMRFVVLLIDSFACIHLELTLSSEFYGVLIEDCAESEMNLLETLSERDICSFGVCVRVRLVFI